VENEKRYSKEHPLRLIKPPDSKQVLLFNGGLVSLISILRLGFPRVFRISIDSELYPRRNAAETAFLQALGYSYHDHAFIRMSTQGSDEAKKLFLQAAIAAHSLDSNVVHLPISRHDLLKHQKTMTKSIFFSEARISSQVDERFFQVSTPVASQTLTHYIYDCLKKEKDGRYDHRVPIGTLALLMGRAVHLDCEHWSETENACGICLPCFWSFVHLRGRLPFPTQEDKPEPLSHFAISFDTDPLKSDAAGIILSSVHSYDALTRANIERAQGITC
jgi:hypothetical protein